MVKKEGVSKVIKAFDDCNQQTQKPQDIFQRIIKASSNENDNVLIPFAGSGSEIVGCKELKRNCIAFEIESKYIEIIKQRTNDAGTLF